MDAKIKEARKYPLDELDEGDSGLSIFNYNVLDFVKIPVKPGIYEIYVTCVGLESNHAEVEIIFEK